MSSKVSNHQREIAEDAGAPSGRPGRRWRLERALFRAALTDEEVAGRVSRASIACELWWTPLYASTARDVSARHGREPDDRAPAQRSEEAHAARLKAQVTARRNRKIPYNPFGADLTGGRRFKARPTLTDVPLNRGKAGLLDAWFARRFPQMNRDGPKNP